MIYHYTYKHLGRAGM